MVENKENITKIIMRPFAECRCEIGRDWYNLQYEVTFVPGACYPDYMTVAKFVAEHINGKELNIEGAVDALGTMLKNKYAPKELTVVGTVTMVTTHFPVTVIKKY